jgi:hypothetical protein
MLTSLQLVCSNPPKSFSRDMSRFSRDMRDMSRCDVTCHVSSTFVEQLHSRAVFFGGFAASPGACHRWARRLVEARH